MFGEPIPRRWRLMAIALAIVLVDVIVGVTGGGIGAGVVALVISLIVAFGARMTWPDCTVMIAGSGAEALRLFSAQPADLVINRKSVV